MTTPLPISLAPILRRSFEDIDEEALGHLLGMSEAADLEFKSDRIDNRKLAITVAAMANSGGGLIVFGITDDGHGRAAGLQPLAAGPADVVLSIQQAVAQLVAPHPGVSVRAVTSSQTSDGTYYLLAVPPSAWAPHAVVYNQALRYVARDGPSNRILTETEVADRYRRRLTTSDAQDARLERLVDAAKDVVRQEIDPSAASLIVCLAPTPAAGLRLDRHLLQSYETWLRDLDSAGFPTETSGSRLYVSVDFRQLRISDVPPQAIDATLFASRAGVLHVDGGGLIVFQHPHASPAYDIVPRGQPEKRLRVFDYSLVADLINALGFLVQHAARAGAFGDAAVAAALVLPLGDQPLVLSSSGRGMVTTVGSRPLWSSTEVSRHTINLDEVGVTGRLTAARMIAADLFSAFGEPEPAQLSVDGAVNLERFPQQLRPEITAWLERNQPASASGEPGS